MQQRTTSITAWGAASLSLALLGGAFWISKLDNSSLAGFGLFGILIVISFSVLGALIAAHRPGNPIGWLFCGIGVSFGLAALSTEWATSAFVERPGMLPFGGFMSWLGTFTWSPGIVVLFTFLILLFPDGHLPSRRWRPIAWLSGVALFLVVVPIAVTGWSVRGPLLVNLGENAPSSAPTSFKLGYNLQVDGILLTFVLGLAAAASVVVRLRRARGDERQQLRWIAFAAAIGIGCVILTSPLFHLPSALGPVGIPLIPAAAAIAVLKYRLYDIDVVIRKTIVLGTIAVFITAVYMALVVGPILLIGSSGGSRESVLLSAVAAAVVAVAFQPVRQRAHRFADRLVYGKRATPYEVLSEFSGRVGEAYAADDVLPRMAQVLAAGTGAEAAAVWLRVGGELRPAAVWPAEASVPTELPPDAVDVLHQGDLLGALSVAMPPSDPMEPVRRKLVEDLASQAGLVLRNVRLIEELRASRQRLVAAQDEERRKIERNIHDGAQQQLVALAVKLRLAETLATGEGAEKTAATLEQLQSDAGTALEDLRDLARGIFPPLLADKGLPDAIASQARKSPVPVDIDADNVGRYRQEVEAAVYFCSLEALQNVAKYAHASRASVRLTQINGSLTFEVTDDGDGFDPASIGYGTGLQGMADRLDALGGTLEVRSAPGEGTAVTGRVPSA
ncbi:MAG: sensor histidine kinase [Actinomycetota bacterium]|nr:sensor histidine kinase [Actinomycetota bacterium]